MKPAQLKKALLAAEKAKETAERRHKAAAANCKSLKTRVRTLKLQAREARKAYKQGRRTLRAANEQEKATSRELKQATNLLNDLMKKSGRAPKKNSSERRSTKKTNGPKAKIAKRPTRKTAARRKTVPAPLSTAPNLAPSALAGSPVPKQSGHTSS